jgi:hypothetical protein
MLGTADLLQSAPGSAGGNGETFSTFYATRGTATSERSTGETRRRMERGLTMWTAIIWQAWIVSSTLNAIKLLYSHGFQVRY